MTKANLLQKEEDKKDIAYRENNLEKARLKKAAARDSNTVTMPNGRIIDATQKEQRSSYERKGFVRVYKNMTPANIQDALDKGFRAVLEEDKQIDRSGGQTLSDSSLLRQLWMEIPIEKWNALKKTESSLRIDKNRQHVKKHIYNKSNTEYGAEFSSPNLGSGIDLSKLKEEHLQQ